ERIERDEGVRVRKARKPDALVGEKLLHHGRVPGARQERDVDLARQQLFAGRSRREGQQLADLLLAPRPLHQLDRQSPRPAAFWPDRYLPAAQAVDPCFLDLPPTKPPHGLVEERPE